MNSNGHHYRELHWPENPADRLLSTSQWNHVATAAALTPRERQVTELLLEGQTRAEIADQLGLKPRTVRQHMENLHSKFQVTNRIGVAMRVISLRDQMCEKTINGSTRATGTANDR